MATSRKRVLRGLRVISVVNRRQRVREPCYRAPKSSCCRRRRRYASGRLYSSDFNGLVGRGRRGPRTRACGHRGLPRNLGGPVFSILTAAVDREIGIEVPWPRASTYNDLGEQICNGWVRRIGTASTKETKSIGRGDRESDRPIVPVKRGNSTREDPVEGRGAEWLRLRSK